MRYEDHEGNFPILKPAESVPRREKTNQEQNEKLNKIIMEKSPLDLTSEG